MVKPKRSSQAKGPPYVGALLRLALQRVRLQMDADVRAAGFTDLQPAHAPILSYPPPDGVRLSQLARRVGMTPQATNYLVSQLEEMGYLERRAVGETSRRLIFLTRRGHKLVETYHASLRTLEATWACEVGQERFDTFMDVLRQLEAKMASR
jgi:DNA-binding MarR family transcriptional regulator